MARRSNQSILKEINPEYALEELMLKLKLKYFGYLMWRADSLEKIEGRRRRGQQRTRWLDAIIASAKSLQSCLTLCDPIDGSPRGSPVPGIVQARTLEWVAISFSNAWKWKWSRSVVSDSSWPHGRQPTRLLHPWDFPGKNTGVGCHCLLWLKRTIRPPIINMPWGLPVYSQICSFFHL